MSRSELFQYRDLYFNIKNLLHSYSKKAIENGTEKGNCPAAGNLESLGEGNTIVVESINFAAVSE